MASCLIGLGSNLGDRRQTLDGAIARLVRHPQMSVVGRSGWHATSPIGGPGGQPAYLNGAAVVETSLAPQAVLEVLLRIEAELGRRRSERWEPRPVDLDLLLYDQQVIDTPSLVLPHPRMAWRRFVLEPAAEVAGHMVHPPTGWTVARLLDHLQTALPYVAITGSIGAGKTHLAQRLAERLPARLVCERLDLELLEEFYADPASHAWATELEFLQQRARLLGVDLPDFADSPDSTDRKRLMVSDFWFDQSLAFARVWLPADKLPAFRAAWQRWRGRVVRPKLIVVLDAPGELLLKRVLGRGRRCERRLSARRLEEIGRSILDQAAATDQGPVLRVAVLRETAEESDRAIEEVQAAIEAMQS